MREVIFDRSQAVPEVEVQFRGPRKRSTARVIFDTGSGLTQLDVKVLESSGYSVEHATRLGRVTGATGNEWAEGYIVQVPKLFVFGVAIEKVEVLAYDFDNFPGIDGLLGFDVIKRFHLEMDGSNGRLKIFSTLPPHP
jgi:hypothetical protein